MSETLEEGAPAPAEPATTDRHAQAEAALEAALAARSGAEAPAATPPAAGGAAPAPEAPVQPPMASDLDARIQAAARLEAEALRVRQEGKAELEQARAAAKAALERAEAMERELAENPLTLLERHKWDLESLVRLQAMGSTPEAVAQRRLQDELKQVKDGIAARDRAAAEAAAAAERQAARQQLVGQLIPAQVSEIKAEIPLVAGWFSEQELANAVFDLMGRELQRTNGRSTLEPKEAARQLEKQLRERVQRLPGATVTAPAETAPSKPNTPMVRPSATLTNQQTQSRGAKAPVDPFDRAALLRNAIEELNALSRRQA